MQKTPSQIYSDLLAGDSFKLTFTSDTELAKFKNQLSVAKHRETAALKKSCPEMVEKPSRLLYQIKPVGKLLVVTISLQDIEPTYEVELVTDDGS